MTEQKRNERFTLFLDNIANSVIRHYKWIAAAFLILTVIISLGISKITFETDFVNYLKNTNKIKKDITFIEAHLRGTVPVELVIEAKATNKDFTHPESIKLIETIQQDILRHMEDRYTTTFSSADYFKEIHQAFNNGDIAHYQVPDNKVDIIDYYEIGDDEILDKIISPNRMKARISFSAKFGSTEYSKRFTRFIETHVKDLLGSDYTYKFTGLSAMYVLMDKNLKNSQLRSFGTAFILIFIMMFFVCKNIKLTIISMIPNIFPIGLTLGVMGWFHIPLDSSTIMIASVTIGIAVDDTVHFITWFRRNMFQGLSIENAIRKTFRDTGKPIVMTSVVLCISYFILTTGSVKPIIAFGALAGLAMFFALIGDLFILPAVILIFKPSFLTDSQSRQLKGTSSEKEFYSIEKPVNPDEKVNKLMNNNTFN